MDQPLPPPGFYPDPSGSGHQRWWDGTAWTQHLAPVAPVPAPMSADAVPAGPVATLAREATATSVMPAVAVATPSRSRRISAPVVALVVVALALVGGLGYYLTKGSSSSKKPVAAVPVGATTRTGTTAHPATTPQPVQSLKQRLQAIDLVQADLPVGYVAQPPSKDDGLPKGTTAPACAKQLGLTSDRGETSADSPDFDSVTGQISSSVDFETSRAVVQRDLAKASSPALLSCLQGFMRTLVGQALRASGATPGDVEVGQMTNLGPQSFGYRITTVAVAPGGTAQRVIYVDILGVAVGRAEITLEVMSSSGPPDGQLEGALVATLRQRAQQARLPS